MEQQRDRAEGLVVGVSLLVVAGAILLHAFLTAVPASPPAGSTPSESGYHYTEFRGMYLARIDRATQEVRFFHAETEEWVSGMELDKRVRGRSGFELP